MIISFGHICIELQMILSKPLIFPCSITSDNGSIFPSGSALNQIISAARCGAKTSIIGSIGNDLFGKTILDTLRREGVQTSGIAKNELPTSIINSIINDNGEKASITIKGANINSSADQVPNNSLNEKNLIMLQNDMDIDINMSILTRAKDNNAHTIICLEHDNNIAPALFNYIDIAIVNDSISVPENKNPQIIAIKHKNRAFDAFCGSFSACVQAGMSADIAIKYGNIGAELTSDNGFPYLCDIEQALKNQAY